MLSDRFGRRFEYLRLSVTDACNFRCIYCLPKGYSKRPGAAEPLSLAEIENLAGGFAELGLWKVRLTGGEPTLRRDIVDIVRALKGVQGIRRVALTTNGHRLKDLAGPLGEAGLDGLNLSVDSLDPARFREITGRDELEGVLGGLQAALRAGIESIKLNVVLLRNMNADEIDAYLELVRGLPVAVRFIELMRTGGNAALFESERIPGDEVRRSLEAKGWSPRPRGWGDGPAIELENPKYRGRIGLIAPYSRDFCAGCNRLRVSSAGALRLCLFGEGDYSIREYLGAPERRRDLIREAIRLIDGKPEGHRLGEGRSGNLNNLAAIGG